MDQIKTNVMCLRSRLLSRQPWLPGPPMGFTPFLPIFAISAPKIGYYYPLNRFQGRS